MGVQRPMAAAAIAALAMARASAPSTTPPLGADSAADTDPPAESRPTSASSSALPAHADDVVDYTLRAKLDPVTHTVAGTGTIHFRNTSTQAVSELWLHLYLNAFKNDRSAFLRERVGGRGSAEPASRGSIVLRRLALVEANGPSSDLLPRIELHRPGDDDETDARVPLPRELPPGASIDLDVAFEDRLPVVIERTGYVDRFHMVGQWFPKNRAARARWKLGPFPLSPSVGVLRGLRNV